MKKSEKVGEISEIFGKNRTNEIFVHFSFRGSPKNDISAKYRPKKPKFLSMLPFRSTFKNSDMEPVGIHRVEDTRPEEDIRLEDGIRLICMDREEDIGVV